MAVEPDSAGVRFPPPFVYLGALLLGLEAERFVTLRSFGIDWRLLVATGALLFVTGAAMMLAAAGLFRRLGTNIPPSQPTTLIATTGPYRWTRNPMYLGMALIYAGLAIAVLRCWQQRARTRQSLPSTILAELFRAIGRRCPRSEASTNEDLYRPAATLRLCSAPNTLALRLPLSLRVCERSATARSLTNVRAGLGSWFQALREAAFFTPRPCSRVVGALGTIRI